MYMQDMHRDVRVRRVHMAAMLCVRARNHSYQLAAAAASAVEISFTHVFAKNVLIARLAAEHGHLPVLRHLVEDVFAGRGCWRLAVQLCSCAWGHGSLPSPTAHATHA